jgi:DNA replicative helicase MCM subunit Mcm2 (Cdc46/Mcm family)
MLVTHVHGTCARDVQAVTSSMKTADWQKVRLQELLSVTQQGPQGAAARTVEAELSEDCVRSCKCGDTVSVLGFVRVMRVDEGASSSSKSGVMLIYIEAVSVINHTASRGALVAQVCIWPPTARGGLASPC